MCVNAKGANAFFSFLGGNAGKCRKRGNSATGRHFFLPLFAQVQRNKFMEIGSGIRNSALT